MTKSKILSFIIAISICFVSVFYPSAFAGAAETDSIIGSLVDCTFAGWSEVPEEARQLAQAYVDLFKSTSLKDTISCVEDIPISWLKTIGSVQYALSPASDIVYLLDESGVLEVENGHSSHGGRHRVGNEQDDVVVGGDQFKKHLDDHSTYYEPTGSTNKVSWSNDKYFKNWDISQEKSTVLTFIEGSYLFCIPGKRQLYAIPYFEKYGETFYFNSCLYFDVKVSGLELYQVDIKGVNVFDTIADLKDPDVYSSLFEADESLLLSIKNNNSSAAYGYLYIPSKYYFSDSQRFDFMLGNFNILTDSTTLTYSGSSTSFKPPSFRFYRSDNLTISDDGFFGARGGNFTNGVRTDRERQDVDWGFIVSDTPILMDGMGADIDTTKIPDNYYITVSGDTIYDYSITNPETGQSSTVNEYITNNYTYITNNPGGDGGGSGTTGGNVSVGGNVGVNGDVNVGGEVKFGGEVNVGVDVSPIDINVNVNSGAGESGSDHSMPDTAIFNDYLDDALEESTGIRKFIGDFFGSLPGEITTLVCIGLVLAILCRLLGR